MRSLFLSPSPTLSSVPPHRESQVRGSRGSVTVVPQASPQYSACPVAPSALSPALRRAPGSPEGRPQDPRHRIVGQEAAASDRCDLRRPGLDTGAWAAWVLGCRPFSAGLVEASRTGATLPLTLGGEEAPAARAGPVGRGFLAISGRQGLLVSPGQLRGGGAGACGAPRVLAWGCWAQTAQCQR